MPSSSSASSSTSKPTASTAGGREVAVAKDAQERITGQSEKRESSTTATFVSAVLSMSPLNNGNKTAGASKSSTGNTAKMKATESDPTTTIGTYMGHASVLHNLRQGMKSVFSNDDLEGDIGRLTTLSARVFASYNAARLILSMNPDANVSGYEILAELTNSYINKNVSEILSQWEKSVGLILQTMHSLALFTSALKLRGTIHSLASGENLRLLLSELQSSSEIALDTHVPSAAVVVLLPHTVTVIYKPLPGDPLKAIFVIFDTLPNASLKTSAPSLSIFHSSDSVIGYLLELFYVPPSKLSSIPASEIEQLTHFTAQCFIPLPLDSLDPASRVSVDEPIRSYDQTLQILQLQSQLTLEHQRKVKIRKEAQEYQDRCAVLSQYIVRLRQERSDLTDELAALKARYKLEDGGGGNTDKKSPQIMVNGMEGTDVFVQTGTSTSGAVRGQDKMAPDRDRAKGSPPTKKRKTSPTRESAHPSDALGVSSSRDIPPVQNVAVLPTPVSPVFTPPNVDGEQIHSTRASIQEMMEGMSLVSEPGSGALNVSSDSASTSLASDHLFTS
ncbi:hypothetical protein SISNIDRAFT_552433 [Sistotremastrum niveocremeum HHB9708]|uniref:Uncharacterized protein n=1 Tax=Sistotremastrum niveocremeum HHB9708 TaxID=1314777 RepID=A0A164PL28_9AGAM|nr:hypothetical protein SISNIDRAFT_552433 [Sistotremastrum niveocremeum HHB9708]